MNDEELAYGLRSIAVPVRGASGDVVAAINLAVHRTMVSLDDLIVRLGPALTRCAGEISARLGYRSRLLETAEGAGSDAPRPPPSS